MSIGGTDSFLNTVKGGYGVFGEALCLRDPSDTKSAMEGEVEIKVQSSYIRYRRSMPSFVVRLLVHFHRWWSELASVMEVYCYGCSHVI